MTALPRRCFTKLSACLKLAFHIACLFSMTVLPRHYSTKLSACLPPALLIKLLALLMLPPCLSAVLPTYLPACLPPALPIKLLALLLSQFCFSAVLSNYLFAFLQPYPCPACLKAACLLSMTALPQLCSIKLFSCFPPALPVKLLATILL